MMPTRFRNDRFLISTFSEVQTIVYSMRSNEGLAASKVIGLLAIVLLQTCSFLLILSADFTGYGIGRGFGRSNVPPHFRRRKIAVRFCFDYNRA